ncbi:Myb-like DNA-binding domain protein (macronuclear) [Tetrahymena thermophila SB210]|uniref:Myb-like DNA-binding domain protein n=1 Tax=Tetrahymena thermophila (strain SB210) TaxID=312017 RepID=Q23CM9_TETTS|nr:Myb-like DNA-binding domain protein [Tetrahymena thermophila SB210]EAR94251.4 Myb-like DNA-binding domain protein [Tetrahymena thermophila SB210]|eukprot:XP_001014496.4 Myb-like DNA-binding domain protein [Tetrahymena thermophila SB210]
MNEEDQSQNQPQMMFVKMDSQRIASFDWKKQSYTNQLEEENKFLQDTQEATTFSNCSMCDDVSTVDGEEDNLQYIASEILKEKRSYYYQVKKQAVKKMVLGTRQTENTKQKRWSYSEEIAFWQLLAQHGTNFDFISKEIKTKTRKQVMLKFNREDKKNSSAVDQALKGQIPAFIQPQNTTTQGQ